jgi:hypothetical protein
MTLPIDPLATLVAFLQADADLSGLVGASIYGGDRPAQASGAALTLRLSGGSPRPDIAVADVLVDMHCWGGVGPDGPHRATSIWRATHAALNVTHRAVASAHLLWALEDRGPVLLRDPDSNEAFVRATVRIATADDPTAP